MLITQKTSIIHTDSSRYSETSLIGIVLGDSSRYDKIDLPNFTSVLNLKSLITCTKYTFYTQIVKTLQKIIFFMIQVFEWFFHNGSTHIKAHNNIKAHKIRHI